MYLQKSLEKERGITQIMTRDNIALKKEVIKTKTQHKIQIQNVELRKGYRSEQNSNRHKMNAQKKHMKSIDVLKN